jgi:hypothetical protein
MVHRFLAIQELPPEASPREVTEAFERVTEQAHHLGLRPVETFYSLQRRRAYTYVESDTEERLREAFAAAGPTLPLVEVVPGERLYTDLLDEPHRYR